MVMKPDIEIRRYGTRNWAVYEGGELLAVTVYKKGALAIVERLAMLLGLGKEDSFSVVCGGEAFRLQGQAMKVRMAPEYTNRG